MLITCARPPSAPSPSEEHRALVMFDDDAPRLLDRMAAYEAPAVAKGMDREER